MNKNNDKGKKSKLVILSDHSKEKEQQKINLSEDESALKEKLISIENKIDSLEKIINVINDELPETFYSSDMFYTIIASSALKAATEVVNDYLGVNEVEKEEKDNNEPLI